MSTSCLKPNLESKWGMDDSFAVQNEDIWASDQVQKSEQTQCAIFQASEPFCDICMGAHRNNCWRRSLVGGRHVSCAHYALQRLHICLECRCHCCLRFRLRGTPLKEERVFRDSWFIADPYWVLTICQELCRAFFNIFSHSFLTMTLWGGYS